MKAALRGSYLEYVIFMGMSEIYPPWCAEELYRSAYLDESRFTMWMPKEERRADYHEKELIELYSVFLRKPNGDLFLTDLDICSELYTTFSYDALTNSGIVAFNDDCIEYVKCVGGVLSDKYPNWFYEYFTEALNYPYAETIYIRDDDELRLASTKGPFLEVRNGEITVTSPCVFLRNKYGEIKGMGYDDFLKHYDPDPKIGG